MDDSAERPRPVFKSKRMQEIEYHFDTSLEDLLTRWFEEGLTPERIAWKLTDQGFPVTGVSVRNWITSLGGRIRRRLVFPTETTAAR